MKFKNAKKAFLWDYWSIPDPLEFNWFGRMTAWPLLYILFLTVSCVVFVCNLLFIED